MTGAGKSLNYLSGEVLSSLNIANTSGTVTANVLTGTNNLTVYTLEIGASGSFTAPAGTLTVTGAIGSSNAVNCNATGTFIHSNGTVALTSSSNQYIRGTNMNVNWGSAGAGVGFYNLTMSGANTKQIRDCDVLVVNDLTVASGPTFSNESSNNVLTVTGDVDVVGTLNLSAGGDHSFGGIYLTGTWTASGGTTDIKLEHTVQGRAFRNNGGNFTHSSGTILLSRSGDQAFTPASETYNNITTSGSGDKEHRGSGAWDINGTLTVGSGTTVSTQTSTQTIDLAGDASVTGTLDLSAGGNHNLGSLTIASGGTYNATSGTTSITGEDGGEAYRNNGTFTHNNGLLQFSQTAASSAGYFNILNASSAGTHTFYDLKINAGSSSAHHSFFHKDIVVLNEFTKVGVRNFANTGGSVARTLTVHGKSKLENGVLGDAGTTGTYAFLGGLDIIGGTLQIGSSHTIQASGIRNLGGTIT